MDKNIIIIIILFLLVWCILNNSFVEPYLSLFFGRGDIVGRGINLGPSYRTKMRKIMAIPSRKKHAVLTHDNKLKYISWTPPIITNKCIQVECPTQFDDNIICWKCYEIK